MFLRGCLFPCFGSNDSSQLPVQHFSSMAASKLESATSAFVVVLLALARRYKVLLQVDRESPTEQLVKSYRKLLRKRPLGGAFFGSVYSVVLALLSCESDQAFFRKAPGDNTPKLHL